MVNAAYGGHAAVIVFLAAHGANVNVIGGKRSPLVSAVKANSLETVVALLSLGANPTQSDVDGQTPLAAAELAKRTARKFEAKEAHEEVKEVGTAEDIEKFSRRTVRVTREHNEECKRLLKLMGIPYMDAPCEAEAQCAELARGGKVCSLLSERASEIGASVVRCTPPLRKIWIHFALNPPSFSATLPFPNNTDYPSKRSTSTRLWPASTWTENNSSTSVSFSVATIATPSQRLALLQPSN